MKRYHAPGFDRFLTYAAALAVTGATISVLSATSARKPAEYRPGDKFAVVRGLDPSRSPATLVMFIDSRCAFCLKSAEVFHQITHAPRTFQTIVIGYEKVDSLRRFVDTSSIAADAVLTVREGTIHFSQVPRVAILDRLGIVRFTWSGSRQINDSAMQILIAARDIDAVAHPKTGLEVR